MNFVFPKHKHSLCLCRNGSASAGVKCKNTHAFIPEQELHLCCLLSTACPICIFCKTATTSLIETPYISTVLCASYIRTHGTHSTLNPAGGKSLSLNTNPPIFFCTWEPITLPSSLGFQAGTISSGPDEMILATGLYFQLSIMVCACVCFFKFILNIFKLLGVV